MNYEDNKAVEEVQKEIERLTGMKSIPLPGPYRLSDEEVWLRAYLAAMVWNERKYPKAIYANLALEDFKKKFRKEVEK